MHSNKKEGLKILRKEGFSTRDSSRLNSPTNYAENQKMNLSTTPEIDYSSKDFNKVRSVIDAASRNNQISETNLEAILNNQYSNRRIRQVGDTTIVTENRDPYSFYWQLNKQKKVEEEPIKRPPIATDYVIDVEEYEPIEVF